MEGGGEDGPDLHMPQSVYFWGSVRVFRLDARPYALGPAMDALGGRAMLLVSFAASAICYGITASATSLTALYISRCEA